VKISFKNTKVSFASVNPGETFASADGEVYIKTEPDTQRDMPCFGCSLDSGYLRHFKGDEYVHSINMEVIER